ncbi:UNVERIFIED_CONTAM: ABC transporter D family member 2, chloroplastic [Sesamum calycinum]|uniref:ABC transporter D family member 2, chloroplastic n=1 Tax=Sesamum calycinum TaxID=2727403 RepID=A0AAW2MDR2_9LAMI
MTSKMVGVESPAHLPPQNFYRAQAFSSATRVVFSTSQLNSSNFKHHRLYCFALSHKYSFYIDSRRRNHKDTSFSSFVCRSSLASAQTEQRFWKVAAPYWFSDDKIQARWQLAAVFALTLATTGISVGFNFLGRDFYNSLARSRTVHQAIVVLPGKFAGGIPVSTLLHFLSNILYGIYPPLFLVLLGYSLGGTAISVYLGRGLVTLNFLQEKKEADFRYGLVRVRENAESIAFYNGEENEMQLLLQRFRSAFENLSKLLISSRNLEFFTNGYRYLIQILPAAVVAPMYFSGKIEFGVINQSVSAFNHILGDFSLIVYQFQAISAFSAVIDRLGSLPFLMRGKDMDASPVKPTTDDLIRVLEDVRLGYILSRFDLDCTYEWSSVLSIGEQQRLAFARLLLSKPKLVLLDESTSALDEANEAHLYKLIGTTGITYISIGHRRTLYEHHKNVLHISPVEPTSVLPNWSFEPIKKDSAYNLSKQ